MGGGLTQLFLPETDGIALSLEDNGTGTIAFGDPPPLARLLFMRWYPGIGYSKSYQQQLGLWSGGPMVPSFERIDGAQTVYDLCMKGQEAPNPMAAVT